MDLLPRERFRETTRYFKSYIKEVVGYYLTLLPPTLIKNLESAIDWFQPFDYEEIKGISEELDVDLPIVLLLQYVYEISAFCTSVVARTSEELIVHDRNLDFAFSKMMGKMTYIGKFTKGG